MTEALSLPPSIQERTSGWVKIQERRAREAVPFLPGPTITLSRQFGCEGFPLSLRLKALLEAQGGEEWGLFDKELLAKVSQDEGISMRLLSRLGDPALGLESFGFHPRGAVTGWEAYARLAETLLAIARHGRTIIVGQGGAILCRELENCFHFRLEASFEWRVASYARRMGVSTAQAEHRVKSQGKIRDRFIQDCLDADLSDRSHYDAIFNNERHSLEQIAGAIVAYVLSARPLRT